MNYYLFLDDVRVPNKVTWVQLPAVKWTIVRSYKEFKACIEKRGIPHFVSFDHDLAEIDNGKTTGFVEKTGLDCAKYLVGKCLDMDIDFPKYEVHSHNPVGKKNIISFIESYVKYHRSKNRA